MKTPSKLIAGQLGGGGGGGGLACSFDRVLTYTNFNYLSNLQFYCVNTSYPMDNCFCFFYFFVIFINFLYYVHIYKSSKYKGYLWIC